MKRWKVSVLLVVCMLAFAACKETMEEEEKATIYTEEDIYIHSFNCGYLSGINYLPSRYILIETEEQLEYAVQNYSLSEEFESVGVNYPIEEYTYLAEYVDVSSGGYYLHADKVKISEGAVRFVLSEDSYSPKEWEPVPCMMDGFFHIAAIPKEYLDGCDFLEMSPIYPGEENE